MFKMKKRYRVVDDRDKPLSMTGERRFGRQMYEKKRVYYKEFSLFDNGFDMTFDDITIIVGDNGSGKSSLLKYLKPPKMDQFFFSMSKSKEEMQRDAIKKWLDNEDCKLSFVNSPQAIVIEKQLHKSDFINNIGKGKTTLSASEVMQKWFMQEDSNGETTIDYITSLSQLENCLIVLDEPETSLSIKSQLKLAKLLKKISKTNQLVIVTHSPIFMNIANKVYDFESKQYVKTKTYINEQYNYN